MHDLRLVRPWQRRVEVGQSRDRRRRSGWHPDRGPQRKGKSRRGRSRGLARLGRVRRSHGRHDLRRAGGHAEEHGGRAAGDLHLPDQRTGRGRLRAGRRLPRQPGHASGERGLHDLRLVHAAQRRPEIGVARDRRQRSVEPADGCSERKRAFGARGQLCAGCARLPFADRGDREPCSIDHALQHGRWPTCHRHRRHQRAWRSGLRPDERLPGHRWPPAQAARSQ